MMFVNYKNDSQQLIQQEHLSYQFVTRSINNILKGGIQLNDQLSDLFSLFLYSQEKEDMEKVLIFLRSLIEIQTLQTLQFTQCYPFPEIIKILFYLCDPFFTEAVRSLSFQSIRLFLINTNNTEEIGNYFYENNFHSYLFNECTNSMSEIPTSLLLDIISQYIATSENARDSFLDMFGIQFLNNIVSQNVTNTVKEALKVLKAIFHYPLNEQLIPSILQMYYSIFARSSQKYDVLQISLEGILEFIETQVDWFIYIQNQNIYPFFIQFLGDNVFPAAALTILIQIYEKITDYFDEIDLRNDLYHITMIVTDRLINTEKLFISVAKIFKKCFSNIDFIEYLLQIGAHYAISIICEDGSYAAKIAGYDAFVVLVFNGNQSQKLLILETDMIQFLFEALETTYEDIIIGSLHALISIMELISSESEYTRFLKVFNNPNAVQIIEDLIINSNERIANLAGIIHQKFCSQE